MCRTLPPFLPCEGRGGVSSPGVAPLVAWGKTRSVPLCYTIPLTKIKQVHHTGPATASYVDLYGSTPPPFPKGAMLFRLARPIAGHLLFSMLPWGLTAWMPRLLRNAILWGVADVTSPSLAVSSPSKRCVRRRQRL